MSVAAHIYLTSDVRSLDVACAVALVSGLRPQRPELELVSSYSAAAFCLTGNMVDGTDVHHFSVYSESDEYIGLTRLVIAPSTAFWIAVGRRLIRFFGGALLYSDCASDEAEEYYIRKWSYPREDDDDGCLELSKRISALNPLTRDEIDAAAKVAYYQTHSIV